MHNLECVTLVGNRHMSDRGCSNLTVAFGRPSASTFSNADHPSDPAHCPLATCGRGSTPLEPFYLCRCHP
jgi:hypothetical protein